MERIIENSRSEFDEIIKNCESEFAGIRTNRANPSMVEDLPVDYFGAKSPLKQVASISLADPKTLVISPWNKDNLVDIEKAINDSGLNITVNNDGNVIRLILPSLTEERRKELAKILGRKTEEARIRVRKEREIIWDEIQEKEKNGELSEDDKFRMKDQLQILVDEYNQKIQSMSEKKEKEIMEI
jgi:ribosome recycling factor